MPTNTWRRAGLALCALMLVACASQSPSEVPTDGNRRADEEQAVPYPPPPPPPPPSPMVTQDQLSGSGRRVPEMRSGAMGVVGAPYAQTAPQPMPGTVDRDQYDHADVNPIHQVSADPVSTFSIDVDTASYSNVRRFLTEGRLPPQDAVRIEELINYFDYNYALPRNREEPFSTTVSVAPSPWAEGRQLVHIGLQGYDIVPQ